MPGASTRSSPRSERPRRPPTSATTPLLRVHSPGLSRASCGAPIPSGAHWAARATPSPTRSRWSGAGRWVSAGSTPSSASTASTPRPRSPKGHGKRATGAPRPRLARCKPCSTASRSAFALCRPPGHHSGADYLGGYCYLNNAAICAEAAIAAGASKVADPRRRLSPRQRHAGHFLCARRRAVRLDPRRPGDRLSLLLGPCRRDRRGRRRGRDPQPAAAARHRLAQPISRRWRKRLNRSPPSSLSC